MENEELMTLQVESSGELLGHPKGLYICFATELWERFSFYGMKYLLLLYLTKYHLFTDSEGFDVLGAYAGLVYALPVIGGLLADRYLGMRKAVVFGGLLLCCGHLLMAIEGHSAIQYAAGTILASDLTLASGTVLAMGTTLTETVRIQDTAALDVFYLALALIVVGVGFLKPNISTIVGQLYAPNDPRRDAGFTIFYMGINIGSFTATLLCGYLGEYYGWGYGFGAAGIGMLLGLAVFLWGQKFLNGLAEPSDPEALSEKIIGPFSRENLIYFGGLASLGLAWLMVQHEHVVFITQNILIALSILALLFFSFFAGTREEFQRTSVLMVLITSTIIFWALFEQSAGSMTLYADRIVDRTFGDITFSAAQFGSLNAGFIMLLAIPFASLWVWLSKRNLEPSTPAKFGLGIIQVGLGFGALVVGAQYLNSSGQVAMSWLVLAYLLHTTGELCLSPVGLSAVTKLSMGRVVGVTMGTWFLATALSETVATRIGKLAAIDIGAGEGEDSAQALATYTQLFEFLMWFGLGAGILMLVITPLLKKSMHGIH